MDAVKLREQYQQALLLLSNVQQQSAISERSLSQLSLLIRLCYSVQKAATFLHDKDSSSIWRQRAVALQNDLATTTADFLQSADQSGEQFWHGCLRLLYAGAEAYDQVEMEKEAVVSELVALKEQCDRLEQSLHNQHQKIETGVKESRDFQTKIAEQQQILESLDQNYRKALHRLDVIDKEKHALSTEKEVLAEQQMHHMQSLERQANAIQQLMEQCEISKKGKDEALESLKSISADNHTLRVNLGQHGQVIENLINLNAEMMDAVNKYALKQEETVYLEKEEIEKESCMVDSSHNEETGDHRLDGADLNPKQTMPLQSLDKQAPAALSPRKVVSGPSVDFFSRIKGEDLSSDAVYSLSITEQPQPLDLGFKAGLQVVSNRVGCSDILLSKRNSRSLEHLQYSEEVLNKENGSVSSDNLRDFEERSSEGPSRSPGRFLTGRLQGVGGKAKGLLNFVTGADLAPGKIP